MPAYLHNTLMETLYTERRKPLTGKFFNNPKGKIGKQRLHNQIQFMDRMDDEWLLVNITDHDIRRLLKRNYFDHKRTLFVVYFSAVQFIVMLSFISPIYFSYRHCDYK